MAYANASDAIGYPAIDGAFEIRLHHGLAEITELANPWQALEKNNPMPTFFQSYGWCLYIYHHMAKTGSEGDMQPVVSTAWKGERLIAVWPLAVRRHSGARVLFSLGAPFDQYADLLIDSSANRQQVLNTLITALRKERLADGLILRKVRLTGAAFELGNLGAQIIDEGESAPQVSFDITAPFSEYLKTISSKTRKNLRNYKNRLARLGKVEHRVLTGKDMAPAIAQTYDGRRQWLDAKGMSSAAFRDGHFEEFVRGLTDADVSPTGLVIFALMLDERMIALQWGFIHEGRYYAYLSSRDPEFETYSAGRIHLQYVLEACHGMGIGVADLMVPAVPYKMTWTDVADPLVDIVWPWTGRGYFALNIYEQNLRPRLKRMVKKLPLGVRRLIFSSVNGN